MNLQKVLNILKDLGDYRMLQRLHGIYRFSLISNKGGGQIFGIFEKNKRLLGIEYYSITKSTLEQIFRELANEN